MERFEWMEKLIKYEYEETIREVAGSFHELYKRIEERERVVIMKLELERDEALESIKKNYDKIRKLLETKSTMKKESSMKLTDVEIDKYTKNMSRVNITKLSWDIEPIDQFLIQFCVTDEHEKYKEPYWSKVTRGTEDYEIETPRSIAIDPITNYLYIVDSGEYTDRVQVFDEYGEYLDTLMATGEMISPFGIYLHDQYLYITCLDSPMEKDQTSIVKMDKSDGNILQLKEIPDPIYYPFVDSQYEPDIRIYGCGMYTHMLHVFDDELEAINGFPITLNTIGNKSDDLELEERTKVMSVKVFDGRVFLLLAFTDFAVQVFDMNGNIIRTLIDNEHLREPFGFCFDIFNNIIIVDREQNCVNLYSSITGTFLRQIGDGTGTDVGDFMAPKGIVLGRRQQFVIVDSKSVFALQAF